MVQRHTSSLHCITSGMAACFFFFKCCVFSGLLGNDTPFNESSFHLIPSGGKSLGLIVRKDVACNTQQICGIML